MKPAITIENLSKRFGSITIIDRLSLSIKESAITVILAPSGAGKTTLLRIIAGLESQEEGRIIFHDHELTKPGPEIGFIFQENSAFPWLTVRKNIEFGTRLRANRKKRSEEEKNMAELCAELGIAHLMDHFPSQLSGGQKQRVAIARTLILRPSVILCDESFSALDEITRQEMRELLLRLHRHYRPTIIFITHHVEEALYLADDLILCSVGPLRLINSTSVQFSALRDAALFETTEFLEQKRKIRAIISS